MHLTCYNVHRIGDRGYFVEPTVFAGVTDNMKIAVGRGDESLLLVS